LGPQFKPNAAFSKEKPLVSSPIIQYKPRTQPTPSREAKKKVPHTSPKDKEADQTEMAIDTDIKRERRVYKLDEIAPSSLEMGINAMNLTHPVTLPFLKSDVKEEMQVERDTAIKPYTENEILFFQFPSIMPFSSPEMTSKKPQPTKEDKPGMMRYDNDFVNSLQYIKESKIGKLYVLKSGKMKLRIGDNFFDVDQGLSCSFLQELHYVNLNSKEMFNLGEIDKRIVITPDLNDLLGGK
jgi:hypothetical protein